jgi:hypothetical protein
MLKLVLKLQSVKKVQCNGREKGWTRVPKRRKYSRGNGKEGYIKEGNGE